jgi:hypothetical protein
MLKFYRKNIKMIIWLIILAFAIWGGGSLSVSKDSLSSNVGFVGKEKISQKEFMMTIRYFDLLSRASAAQKIEDKKDEKSKEPLPYEQVKSLAWQMIVLSREAKREGIAVSDEEVQNEIRRLFSANGTFQQDFYNQWVQNQFRVKPRDFEELVRKHIASDKIRQKVLKDVPEAERNSKWLEWLIPVISKSKLKDFEKPQSA